MGTNRRHRARTGIVGLIAGVALGVVAGLLLAPKTGAQVRADIRRTGGVLKLKAGARAVELRRASSSRLDRVRQSIGPTFASVRERGSSMASSIGGRRDEGTTGTRNDAEAAPPNPDDSAETSEKTRPGAP